MTAGASFVMRRLPPAGLEVAGPRRGALLGRASLSKVLQALLVGPFPASARPFIGGSTDTTVLDLVFGYNDFGRLFGHLLSRYRSGRARRVDPLGGIHVHVDRRREHRPHTGPRPLRGLRG